ncbi:MATE family efflux transporter [Paenibacillus sp. N4]|uniref:MATE family efflux transporter n=1 Tax=Paenibacillus vietnamensis TaxID=2590547 RepID=UPI001CD15B7C|nr:MATE family efflux transporter [Paenibacillus vietnamensis]MCA0756489.1 MATE family efflux transporter [Paenibacillus vietnamensis]
MQGKVIYNLIASLTTFSLSVLISLWMTPYIINAIGTDAYGFIPLTQNFISILSVLTVALSSVIARFFTVAIQQNDFFNAQRYFNTYLISSIIISGFLLIVFFTLSLLIDDIINIPKFLTLDVEISIIISGLLLVMTYIGAVFDAAPFSTNKLYITKGIEALNAILKAICVFILLTALTPKIWYVNLGAIIAGVLSFILGVFFFRKLLPFIKFNYKDFQLSKLKEMLSAGIWNSIGQVGVILFLAIDILVANKTVGAEKAGIYAAILQLPLLVRSLAGITANVFAPVVVTLYAKKNINALVEYSNKAVRLNGLLIALPASLICGLSSALLNVWLGEEFETYNWLLVLNSIYLVFVLSVMPLNHIFTAVNRLKLPAIVTIILGITNLILAYLLSGPVGLGLYGIVIASASSLCVKNLIFTPLYSSFVTGQAFYKYYKGIIQPIIGAAFAVIVSIIIKFCYNISNWMDLIIAGLIITISYILFSYVSLLNREEKQRVKKLVIRLFYKNN